MKRYSVKTLTGKMEFFDIISEGDEEYKIRLTRLSDGSRKTFEETMPKNLFDMCVKTGYIFELEEAAASVA